MIQVVLAGLVYSGFFTLEEAESLFERLKNKKVPDSVKECYDLIEKAKAITR